MAKETTHYHLIKPDLDDFYAIADFNANADVLDSALKALSDNVGGQMPKPATGRENNVAVFDKNRGVKDSGVKLADKADREETDAAITNINSRLDRVLPRPSAAAEGNLAVFAAARDATDSKMRAAAVATQARRMTGTLLAASWIGNKSTLECDLLAETNPPGYVGPTI